MKKLALVFLLLLILFSLLSVSCELFNNTADPNYLDKLYEEVAWANAEKLNITMVYPQEWGSAPDNFFDNVRTTENPRMGYPFTVQFAPAAAFGDAQWRAYKTADLALLDSNWYINSANVRTTLAGLDSKMLTPDEINFSVPIGSRSSVIINIPDPVTIIPWSYMQPRIIQSSPSRSAVYPHFERTANRDITITFAAAVNKSTLIFETGYIEITSYGEDTTADFISPPSYDEDTYTMTIHSRGSISAGKNIELKLGTNILSPGEGKGMNEPVTFSWRTVTSEFIISKYNAFYNDKNKSIEVKWEMPAGTTMQPNARLRINNGSTNPINLSSATSLNILNIDPPDYSGFNSYTIFLDLGDNTTTMKLWNVPGMNVSDTDTITEINSPIDFAAIPANAAGQYVLTDNITLNAGWIPVGTGPLTPTDTDYIPFRGKFYGAGRTIRVNGSPADRAYSGIFGYVQNAEIRDLTVDYAVDVDVGTATTDELTANFNLTRTGKAVGGLAGLVRGNSVISNIIVKGAGTLSVKTTSAVYSGIITGFMDDTVLIKNCYTNANLLTESTGGIWTGGIVGYINGPITGLNDYMIQDITVAGNITADADTGSLLYIGGVAGYCAGRGKIENAEVSATLTMLANNTTTLGQNNDVDNGNFFAGGGIIGRMRAGSIINSNFTGEILTTDAGGEREFIAYQETNIGGLVGRMYEYILADIEIKNSNVSGNIVVTNHGIGQIVIGGIASAAEGGFPIIFNNCEFQGSITSKRNNTTILNNPDHRRGHVIGGFMGAIEAGLNVVNCRSNDGEINVELDGADFRAQIGGFVGFFTGTLNRSYTTTNVTVTINPSFIGYATIGGFAGLVFRNGKLSNSYATGDVTVDSQALDTGNFNLDVGGFAGRIDVEESWQSSDVSRCFALGSVKASALDKTRLYVGGFLGRRGNVRSTIETSVALGQKVTMKGGNPAARGIGRVSGSGDTNNCYAVSTLELWQADLYSGTETKITSTDNLINGTTVNIENLYSPAWWQITSGLNFNNVSGGLGGNTYTWDFSQISNYGYPFLMGIDGQGKR